jgi:hypothetical protein
VDLCFEQTRESSQLQLQLGRVEKSRNSFIGDGVCMYCMHYVYQVMVKLSWVISIPANRLHREN